MLELVSWYMASISTNLGGTLIKQLASPAPLTGLHHAKRVRRHPEDAARLQILVCPVSAGAPDALPPSISSVIAHHSLHLENVGVPKHAPATRPQWEAWGQHWPLTWRAPDPTLQPQYGELLPEEVSIMHKHLGSVVPLATSGRNACVVVDPETGIDAWSVDSDAEIIV